MFRSKGEIVLEQYLASLQKHSTLGLPKIKEDKRQRDDLIRTITFMYGKTFDAAAVVLDSCETHRTVSCVTSATSRRSLYLVKGSSSYRRSEKVKGRRDAKTKNSSYLCIMPSSTSDIPIYFCSCRSFLERSRTASSGRRGPGGALCKHLLAIRLMPFFGLKPSTIETLSDEEFARVVTCHLSIE